MRAHLLGIVVAGLSLFTVGAEAAPHRSGFTGDLGAGLALTTYQSKNVSACVGNVCGPGSFVSERRNELGLAGPSFSLGGFVSHRVAILARSARTSFFRDDDVFSNDFLGPIVEVWPSDAFYFSAGPGLAVASRNGFFLGTGKDATVGWGLDLRAGLAVLQRPHNDLTLSLEITPAFYDDNGTKTNATGVAFVAAWKWY